MSHPAPVIRPPVARDLGPPTPAECTTIARILIRYGYPVPPPRKQAVPVPTRSW